MCATLPHLQKFQTTHDKEMCEFMNYICNQACILNRLRIYMKKMQHDSISIERCLALPQSIYLYLKKSCMGFKNIKNDKYIISTPFILFVYPDVIIYHILPLSYHK